MNHEHLPYISKSTISKQDEITSLSRFRLAKEFPQAEEDMEVRADEDSTDEFKSIFRSLMMHSDYQLSDGDGLENINEYRLSLYEDSSVYTIEWTVLKTGEIFSNHSSFPGVYIEVHQSDPSLSRYFYFPLDADVYHKLVSFTEHLFETDLLSADETESQPPRR